MAAPSIVAMLSLLFAPVTTGVKEDVAKSVSPVAAVASQECQLPAGWAEIAELKPRFIIFGETHGTRESPAFVGEVACALASGGERVLLAIEHNSTDDAALQAAWRLPVERFDAALREIGWAGRSDGVASQAMFDLVVGLHRLNETGLAIGVTAFNGAIDDAQRARFASLAGQGPHEAVQADNIARAASAGQYDQVLILVGSFHAEKTPEGEGAERFEPMAMRLGQVGPTFSLQMRDAGGSAWNCVAKPGVTVVPGQPIGADAIDCGMHKAGIRGSDLARPRFMQRGPFPGEENLPQRYDGFVWLGPITGSPPLIP